RRGRVVGAREAQPQLGQIDAVPVADDIPIEGVAPVVDETAEPLLEPFGREDGKTGTLEAVPHEHLQTVEVEPGGGMLRGEDHATEILDPGVLLQMREGAAAAVDPHGRPAATDQVAATGAERRSAVGPGRAENRQLHSQASTVSTSGPRNRAPSARKVARSPLVTNTRLGRSLPGRRV